MTRDSTLPKPFVFVLMPLAGEFSDIYKFGIKGAAEDVGAYAERIDDQIFTEGILDRIFNQISKADVIVADMTGRNPNVFYEVGYAHALDKITLLLTQEAGDIPFDLKHRQHIVYAGKIDLLRQDLGNHLRWAVAESRRSRRAVRTERFALYVHGVEALPSRSSADLPVFEATATADEFSLDLHLRNDSLEATNPITHIYLLSRAEARLVPTEPVGWSGGTLPLMATAGVTYALPTPRANFLSRLSGGLLDGAAEFDAQYRLPVSFPAMPPGAVEAESLNLKFRDGERTSDDHFRIRLFSSTGFHEFDFRLRIRMQESETKSPETETGS